MSAPCDEQSNPYRVTGKRGLLFFDTIRDSKVTDHVFLWDCAKVLDAGDYFEKSARIHFWELE